MVVCKYYQQGSCRYGQSCRFDHINNFGRQGNEKYGESKSIVLGVAEEVLAAERGGQWPLSCFGPFKEQPCIPGFEDVSPEEVRWEMYQAQKNNTVDQTKQQFQQLCQDAIAKRNVLKNPTRETATMLEKLQKGTSEPASNNFLRSTLFSTPNPSPSVFGAQANPFTTRNFTPTTTSLFASTATSPPSIFGANTFSGGQSSLFGGATAQPPPFSQGTQNVFAGSSTGGSIFGGNTGNTGNNFGNTNTFTSTASTNLFTSSTTTPSTGIFSNTLGANNTLSNNTLFGQKSAVAFGGAPVFGTGSNFGNAGLFNKPQASVFGTNTAPNTFAGTTSNTFGQISDTTPGTITFAPNVVTTTFVPNAGTTTFGTTFFSSANTAPTTTFSTPFSQPFSASSNTFVTGSSTGTTATTTTTSTRTVTSNPFAPSTQPFANNPFGTGSGTGTFGNASTDPNCYSPAEELTEEEKTSYATDKFVLRKIPLKPPSIEIR